MDEVVQHLETQGILRETHLSAAYRCFLVSKSDDSFYHLRTETEPVCETLFYLKNWDDG
jgi:hypothetical protein